ncbi:MAG: hypothetical protein WBM08_09350 [Prochlorococcaceae cyanobacterium]
MNDKIIPLHPHQEPRIPHALVCLPPYTSRQWTAHQRKLARQARAQAKPPGRFAITGEASRTLAFLCGFLFGILLALYL